MDCLVIIRSIGERTTNLCRQLIVDQGVDPIQIEQVSDAPFSATLRKSLQLGLDSGYKWTFCIDADVLLAPNTIALMLDQAEKQPSNVCEIQGLVMDKFFGGPRPAGNHLYRSSLIPLVIKRIPNEGQAIRPESYALNKMRDGGYPYVQIHAVLGTHDDHQYFKDIYRKSFIQATKHIHLSTLFLTLWNEKRNEDKDYLVAICGFADGLKITEQPLIDADHLTYLEGFKALGLAEKDQLNPEVSVSEIVDLIKNKSYHQLYLAKYKNRLNLIEAFKTAASANDNAQSLSFFNSIYHRLGQKLVTYGKLLQSKSQICR